MNVAREEDLWKKIHAAFIRSSFLSNGRDPAAGFRFKI